MSTHETHVNPEYPPQAEHVAWVEAFRNIPSYQEINKRFEERELDNLTEAIEYISSHETREAFLTCVREHLEAYSQFAPNSTRFERTVWGLGLTLSSDGSMALTIAISSLEITESNPADVYERLGSAIAEVALEHDTTLVSFAYAYGSWMLSSEDVGKLATLHARPSQSPDRKEAVSTVYIDLLSTDVIVMTLPVERKADNTIALGKAITSEDAHQVTWGKVPTRMWIGAWAALNYRIQNSSGRNSEVIRKMLVPKDDPPEQETGPEPNRGEFLQDLWEALVNQVEDDDAGADDEDGEDDEERD